MGHAAMTEQDLQDKELRVFRLDDAQRDAWARDRLVKKAAAPLWIAVCGRLTGYGPTMRRACLELLDARDKMLEGL